MVSKQKKAKFKFFQLDYRLLYSARRNLSQDLFRYGAGIILNATLRVEKIAKVRKHGQRRVGGIV